MCVSVVYLSVFTTLMTANACMLFTSVPGPVLWPSVYNCSVVEKDPDDLGMALVDVGVSEQRTLFLREKVRKQESHALIRSFSLEEGCPGRGERCVEGGCPLSHSVIWYCSGYSYTLQDSDCNTSISL